MGQAKNAEIRAQALNAAVKEHQRKLLSVIRAIIRDRVEADDVAQDVFVELIETYDVGTAIENVGAWLVTVAQNKIFDRFRRRKTQDAHRSAVLAAAKERTPSGERPDEAVYVLDNIWNLCHN